MRTLVMCFIGIFVACQSPTVDSGGQGGSSGGGGAGPTGGIGASGGNAGVDSTAGRAGLPAPSPYAYETRPTSQTCVAPVPPPIGAQDPFPKTLSATGCVDNKDPKRIADGVIPYEVNSALWSDGAGKGRWVSIPKGTTITIEANGHWTLPVGTILIKDFAIDGKHIETRLMVRYPDDWVGYSYKWREDESDADLVDTMGDRRFLPDQTWTFPTRSQCLDCHAKAAGRSLGLETAQTNRMFLYPNGKYANQIATFEHVGLFANPPGDPSKLGAYTNPSDSKAGSLTERARSYLHANCAHCHRPGGIMDNLRLDLRHSTSFLDTSLCGRSPQKDLYGDPDRKVLAPGNLDHSLIYYRMSSASPAIRMPQIGTAVVDEIGSQLIADWITSLSSCP